MALYLLENLLLCGMESIYMCASPLMTRLELVGLVLFRGSRGSLNMLIGDI